MVCLGLEPGAAGWKVQMNPLSYGGTPEEEEKLSHKHCDIAQLKTLT